MTGDMVIGCVAFCLCALTVGFTGLTLAGAANIGLDVLADVKGKAHSLFKKN